MEASKGRRRLRLVDELQLDFDHCGKHAHALSEIAGKADADWLVAAKVLREQLEAGKRRYITPQSIVDNWFDYSNGRAPGPKPQVRTAAVATTTPKYRQLAAAGGER